MWIPECLPLTVDAPIRRVPDTVAQWVMYRAACWHPHPAAPARTTGLTGPGWKLCRDPRVPAGAGVPLHTTNQCFSRISAHLYGYSIGVLLHSTRAGWRVACLPFHSCGSIAPGTPQEISSGSPQELLVLALMTLEWVRNAHI